MAESKAEVEIYYDDIGYAIGLNYPPVLCEKFNQHERVGQTIKKYSISSWSACKSYKNKNPVVVINQAICWKIYV